MYKECSYKPNINEYKDVKPRVYESPVRIVEKPKFVDPQQQKQKQQVLDDFLTRMKKRETEKRERELIVEQVRKMREEELYRDIDIKANLRHNVAKSTNTDKAIRQTIKPKNYVKKPLYKYNDGNGRESGASFKTVHILGKEPTDHSGSGVSQTFELKLDEYVSLNFIVKP